MLASRVGCPLRLKTPNMGNTGQEDRVPVTRIITYGDESGLDEKAEYFLMGGFVGTPLDWKTVRSEWQQVLRQFGVPEFHSADFFGGKRAVSLLGRESSGFATRFVVKCSGQ